MTKRLWIFALIMELIFISVGLCFYFAINKPYSEITWILCAVGAVGIPIAVVQRYFDIFKKWLHR